jgi:predicted DNA repair protein MutK
LSTGLIALLDDIAALAKVAAATLDDAAAQSTKAASKAAGIVIDDAAVTPRYVVGFTADRELPIIARIARGSLINKLVFILPAAILLSAFAPWIITPILMIGGGYLCMEGYHKVKDLFFPHEPHGEAEDAPLAATSKEVEDRMVTSATRTDFILSAEIMVIGLSTIAVSAETGERTPIWLQATILALVGVVMTVLVYGAVALIVKADDVGYAMAQKGRLAPTRAVGRRIVKGMPFFLAVLSHVGMVAMLWVGGGIIIHGLHVEHWWAWPEETIHGFAVAVGAALPALSGFLAWFVQAGISAVIGLGIGALVDPLAKYVITPLIAMAQGKKATPVSGVH